MIICPRCAVELEDAALPCPLCHLPVSSPAGPAPDAAPDAPASRPGVPGEARRRVRRWLLELLTVLAATSSVVVLVIDLAVGPGIGWAHYPLAGIWFLWLAAIAPRFLPGRPGAILVAEFTAAAAFMATLDRFTAGPPWFLPLALPLTGLTATVLAATLKFTRHPTRSPFAAIAAALLAAGVVSVGLDLLLGHFRHGHWHLGWSLVTLGSVLPLVVLLLYLRTWYRQRQAELRKLLHL